MLTRLPTADQGSPKIKKSINGKDVSQRGAFPCGVDIEFTVDAPRALGASAVVLRIARDGCEYEDIPLSFVGTQLGVDTYTATLSTERICGEARCGLFYYEFLFLRGAHTLFTSTHNFVDFELKRHSDGRFLLLVHKKDFKTPDWFCGKTMYHVFVDRFCKGEGAVGTRDDVIINEDWESGEVQYAERRGDELANNMFFGGNLWGVAEKLPYLKSLGVGVIYLSPIFKAYSNHKYDTGNYLEVDGMFGGNEALDHLIKKAAEYDMKIILDGVFNHTGDDSLYFDKYGKYGGVGAYSSPESKYKNWFRFRSYPDDYEDWWGIKILPKLDHTNNECRAYFTGRGGVCESYVKRGIGGWRLDVADELSDVFLDELRGVVKDASNGDAVIIGEVWENAAEKIAYARRRRYLQGDQLDSVMNYPLRNGILAFLLDKDAEFLADTLRSIYASYPKCVCDCLMNIIGTHDTERILTLLGDGGMQDCDLPNATLAKRRLDAESRSRGIELQRLAATVQFTVFGVPSVFYGDEAGLEGYGDPFCRRTFPWGREDEDLLEYYRTLGRIRSEEALFADGEFEVIEARGELIAYRRYNENASVTVVINASDSAVEYPIKRRVNDLITGEVYSGFIPPRTAVILK